MVSRSVAWSLLVAAAFSMAACASSGSPSPSPAAPAALGPEPQAESSESTATVDPESRTHRIVTLGDSYTYGTGTDAPRRDSWPAQLSAALVQRGGVRVYLRNLAQESGDSGQVLEEQAGQVAEHEPDVVTLQVGVNDIVGRESEWYRENVAAIFDELLAVLPPERIFAITTPDHTLTEWGRVYGTHEAVEEVNAGLLEEASARGIKVIDIGPVNERVAVDESLLVQTDPPKPYPTAKQYAAWAETIGPYIYDALIAAEP